MKYRQLRRLRHGTWIKRDNNYQRQLVSFTEAAWFEKWIKSIFFSSFFSFFSNPFDNMRMKKQSDFKWRKKKRKKEEEEGWWKKISWENSSESPIKSGDFMGIDRMKAKAGFVDLRKYFFSLSFFFFPLRMKLRREWEEEGFSLFIGQVGANYRCGGI